MIFKKRGTLALEGSGVHMETVVVYIACLGVAGLVYWYVLPRPRPNCPGCRKAAEHNNQRFATYSGMDSFSDLAYCEVHKVAPFSTRRRKR